MHIIQTKADKSILVIIQLHLYLYTGGKKINTFTHQILLSYILY